MMRWPGWLALLLVVLLTRVAAAGPASEAKTLYERGTTAYALGKFDDAAALFEKAFEIKPDPAILYNAAQAHRAAGNKKKALLFYQNYLRLYADHVQNRAEVERRITELKLAIDAEQAAATNPPTTLNPPVSNEPVIPKIVEPPPPPVVVVAPPPPPPKEKPLVKKGWFWGVMVGAIVVVGAGVGLGVGLGTASHAPAVTFGSVNGN